MTRKEHTTDPRNELLKFKLSANVQIATQRQHQLHVCHCQPQREFHRSRDMCPYASYRVLLGQGTSSRRWKVSRQTNCLRVPGREDMSLCRAPDNAELLKNIIDFKFQKVDRTRHLLRWSYIMKKIHARLVYMDLHPSSPQLLPVADGDICVYTPLTWNLYAIAWRRTKTSHNGMLPKCMSMLTNKTRGYFF